MLQMFTAWIINAKCCAIVFHCVIFFHYTRVEEFAKEDMDLTLATTLEFSTPFADLSDVKTMMDSINVVPGLSYKLHKCFCEDSAADG